MKRGKIIRRILLAFFFMLLGYAVYYAWFSFPIISGFSAKNACSCAFIQGRTKEAIEREELADFPLSIGSIRINREDSSVTGTVFGVAVRKAIYRKGLGCTLVNDWKEKEIRAQPFRLPPPVARLDTGRWLVQMGTGDSLAIRLNKEKLDSAVLFAFTHFFRGKNTYTRAVVVVRNGEVVAEKYAPGCSVNTPFLGWSMAKSITSALIGVLVKDGKMAVKQPAPVPQWGEPGDKRGAITVEHLLQQTSGLHFVEDYGSYSHVTNMLFNKGDMAGYTAKQSLKVEPGTEFHYSSGNSNVLSGIIRRLVGEKDYHSFPYTRLFHKTGMYNTLLEPDASGTFVGSSYVWATARDYARFGCLYLNDGVWNGERILPEGWVKKTGTPAPANETKSYGYQFWLNGLDENNKEKREYDGMPTDMLMADGYGGQRIYIFPSKQLVVVRMGLNRFNERLFLKKVMEAVQ